MLGDFPARLCGERCAAKCSRHGNLHFAKARRLGYTPLRYTVVRRRIGAQSQPRGIALIGG